MGVLAVPHIGDAAVEGAPPASSEFGYTPPSYRGFIGVDLHITPWTGRGRRMAVGVVLMDRGLWTLWLFPTGFVWH